MTHYAELLIIFKESPLMVMINFYLTETYENKNSALGLINCCFFNLKTLVFLCVVLLIQGKSIPFLVFCNFQRNGHIISTVFLTQVIVWTYHAYIYPTENGMPCAQRRAPWNCLFGSRLLSLLMHQ